MAKFYSDDDRPNTVSSDPTRITLGAIVTISEWTYLGVPMTTFAGLPIVMIPPQPKSEDKPLLWGVVIASEKEQRWITCCWSFEN